MKLQVGWSRQMPWAAGQANPKNEGERTLQEENFRLTPWRKKEERKLQVDILTKERRKLQIDILTKESRRTPWVAGQANPNERKKKGQFGLRVNTSGWHQTKEWRKAAHPNKRKKKGHFITEERKKETTGWHLNKGQKKGDFGLTTSRRRIRGTIPGGGTPWAAGQAHPNEQKKSMRLLVFWPLLAPRSRHCFSALRSAVVVWVVCYER